MQPLDLNLRRGHKSITLLINVHVTREFKMRQWIAVRLMRLAAWVLGCGIEIHMED